MVTWQTVSAENHTGRDNEGRYKWFLHLFGLTQFPLFSPREGQFLASLELSQFCLWQRWVTETWKPACLFGQCFWLFIWFVNPSQLPRFIGHIIRQRQAEACVVCNHYSTLTRFAHRFLAKCLYLAEVWPYQERPSLNRDKSQIGFLQIWFLAAATFHFKMPQQTLATLPLHPRVFWPKVVRFSLSSQQQHCQSIRTTFLLDAFLSRTPTCKCSFCSLLCSLSRSHNMNPLKATSEHQLKADQFVLNPFCLLAPV